MLFFVSGQHVSQRIIDLAGIEAHEARRLAIYLCKSPLPGRFYVNDLCPQLPMSIPAAGIASTPPTPKL